jgi:large subunit ribosomal protein L23
MMQCNKIEIKKAVEELFGVTVESVKTYTTHGKIRSRGRFKGKRPDLKRAVVQLKEGDTIEFFEGV